MTKLSRILVPVEFSPRCAGAAHYAEALACHFHSDIVLLHVVVPPPVSVSPFEAMGYYNAADLGRELAVQRTAELEAFPCKGPAGATVRRVVLTGDPARTIVEYAAAEKCDLIVMPTHGYGPFRRFLLGSVTAKVLHDALCPVWTGPHMEQAPDYTAIGFYKTVCAIDLAPHSRDVLSWASGFAREFGGTLSIVHAIPAATTQTGGFYFDPDWRIELTNDARQRIAVLQKELEIAGEVWVEAGDTPAAVAATTQALHGDLLVIGRGSTPRAHGHLPTNSYAIVRGSPCPVVTI